jgi:hypothetical protein
MRNSRRCVICCLSLVACGAALTLAGRVDDYLQANPHIAAQIRLETGVPGSYVAYADWPDAWKDRLEEIADGYVQGTALPFAVPVELAPRGTVYPSAVGYATDEIARDVYLAHVGHMLFLDMNGLLPWRLTDYPDEELSYLLPSGNFFLLASYAGAYHCQTYMGPNAQDAGGLLGDPRELYGFLLREPEEGRKLLGDTQAATVANVSEWFHDYLHHWPTSVAGAPLEFYQAYPYLSDRLRRLPVDGLGNVYISIVGCWSASALFADLVRAVNVPVQTIHVVLEDAMRQDGNHSGLVVSIDGTKRYLPHSDDLYCCWRQGGSPLHPGMSVG